ncbi:unnamed protein product [Ostreobium quekettii]|uniref:Uncharacterized protein n=1 Tax=Ostreobium quekettii TaxID=121088 RepID=A0A8S1JE07_9CHLO|nr:unnamed protein product [Ostreobium quekettii]
MGMLILVDCHFSKVLCVGKQCGKDGQERMHVSRAKPRSDVISVFSSHSNDVPSVTGEGHQKLLFFLFQVKMAFAVSARLGEAWQGMLVFGLITIWVVLGTVQHQPSSQTSVQ